MFDPHDYVSQLALVEIASTPTGDRQLAERINAAPRAERS
jgi:hypothetical protein